jgi:hypothetical protein
MFTKPSQASFYGVYANSTLLYSQTFAENFKNGTAISEWTSLDYIAFTSPAITKPSYAYSPICSSQDSPPPNITLHAHYRPENKLSVVVC